MYRVGPGIVAVVVAVVVLLATVTVNAQTDADADADADAETGQPDTEFPRAVVTISDNLNKDDADPGKVGNDIGDDIRLENLTKSESRKLDELRKRTKAFARPSDEFLFSDRVLIKWLQARDFDLHRAELMFRQTLDWRKANKMESILSEDFKKWEKSYPFVIDGVDKFGRPLFLLPGGKYDIRNALLSGQTDQLIRYLAKQLEFGCHYGTNLTRTTGRNLDGKGIVILDVMGFNFRQHSCLQCIPFHIRSLQMYEANYPRIVHKMFIINAPTGVPELYDVLKHVMSEDTRKLIHIYGFDKAKWSSALLQQIPSDQLPIRYGGTRTIRSSEATLLG